MSAGGQAHKRTSSTAGNENTAQPAAKQPRPDGQLQATRPRCIFIVEHIKKPRPTGDWRDEQDEYDREERTQLGVFVSLANANREVRREMEYFESEWGDLGDRSIFDEESDDYSGTPPTDGEKVGSSWEYDDEQEEVHQVSITAYPLIWPEDYYMSDDEDEEEELEEDGGEEGHEPDER
ncbi:hypothetical protein NKR23_g7263 [Pleurostoma richardsiae]|uniref:Uncharacterized protein n=1 Tax=Pleurostoma richardsiae TaxID=41990 RepID=A0AA38RNJ6_9PEZI|nr:hypothetical protein NKR23_g7263 [Pleurostoma richardsiae]